MKSQGILITGAAGFIGSNCVRYLNDEGCNDLFLCDQLEEGGKWKNLVGKRFRQLIPVPDLFDWLAQPTNAEEISALIHLGACSSTTEVDADFLLRNNTLFSQKLALIAMKHDWRFIYASSAATYGDGSQGFSDQLAGLHDLRPMNMYGYSKHLFDLWALDHGYLDCMVGLKYFNVYGPNEWHKGSMSSHVLRMLPQAQNGEIRLFKSNDPRYRDGEQMRDFIYVKDAARMTCSLLLYKELCGIYNIGLGKPHSWNELAQSVMRGAGCEVPINYIDLPPNLSKQYQNYTCAEMQRWKSDARLPLPSASLDAQISDYIQEHLMGMRYY